MSVSCSPKGKKRLPDWIRVKVQAGGNKEQVSQILETLSLNTVCAEARCPNLHECWQRKTATFMILGKQCTRNCRFCAVDHKEEDLLALDGLERELGFKLAAKGVITLEDLAEQGIDDLEGIEDLAEERAGELIMAARNICWFGEDE